MQLDFNVHAGRDIQFAESVNRLLRRLKNVEQALVRPNFELFPRLPINVGAAQHRVSLHPGWERDRAVHIRLSPLGETRIAVRDADAAEAVRIIDSHRDQVGGGIVVPLPQEFDALESRIGYRFKDADLLGIPWRVVVGRGAADGQVELVQRAGGERSDLAASAVVGQLLAQLERERAGLLQA